jgi:hypothetical protein
LLTDFRPPKHDVLQVRALVDCGDVAVKWGGFRRINKGEIVFPVRMRLTLADGTAKDVALPVQIWATTSMWVARVDTGGKRITRVEIDAANKLPDVDPSNNLWNAEPQSKGKKQTAAPGASDSE